MPWGCPSGNSTNILQNSSHLNSSTTSSNSSIPLINASAAYLAEIPFQRQKMNDGLLEVVGFTATSLAALQVGGHGERLAQCSNVILITSKEIPIQIDGEPSRLKPSTITICLRNQANFIMKTKRRSTIFPPEYEPLGSFMKILYFIKG